MMKRLFASKSGKVHTTTITLMQTPGWSDLEPTELYKQSDSVMIERRNQLEGRIIVRYDPSRMDAEEARRKGFDIAKGHSWSTKRQVNPPGMLERLVAFVKREPFEEPIPEYRSNGLQYRITQGGR